MISEDRVTQAFAYYPRLAKVQEYVAENLGERISLQDAARVASLEAGYFARFFKAKTGLTFSEWLHNVRVNHAKELMQKQDLSVSSVAIQSGFSSERTFLRVFKRIAGTTPSDYKRSATR